MTQHNQFELYQSACRKGLDTENTTQKIQDDIDQVYYYLVESDCEVSRVSDTRSREPEFVRSLYVASFSCMNHNLTMRVLFACT